MCVQEETSDTALSVLLVNPFPHPSLLHFCHPTVIELSAEIAALQTAVLNTRQELKHSMKDKHILQEKASAAQLDEVTE